MIQIPENLKTMFTESAYSLALENRKDNPRYKQLLNEFTALFDDIHSRLGEEHGKLLYNLETKFNEMGGDDDELIYLKGMIDCAALMRLVGLL